MVDLQWKHPEFINGYIQAQKEVLSLAEILGKCKNYEDFVLMFNEFIKCQHSDMVDYLEWWNEKNGGDS